jgi:hypothetical protein
MKINHKTFALYAVILIIAFPIVTVASSTLKPSDGPYVAYVYHGSIFFRSASGKVVAKVSPSKSINAFTVSSDLKSIVFTAKGGGGYGGALYRYELTSGKLVRLAKNLHILQEGVAKEVYSNPDFSSDGRKIVFSVRALPAGDTVEASGPFVLMNLQTKSTRILGARDSSSKKLWPNEFSISSFWSPDDKYIALNYDDGYELVTPTGRSYSPLPDLPSNWDWAIALGWIGRHCLVVQGGDGPGDAKQNPALVVNISNDTIKSLGDMLGLSGTDTQNLVAVTGQLRVQKIGTHLIVDGLGHRWETRQFDDDATVIIIGGQPAEGVSNECR